MPSWIPWSFLIFPPYVIRSSHVSGPLPFPAFSQRLFGSSRGRSSSRAEGVELLRVRVVGASAAERMLFPVTLLGLLDDVAKVEDARLELRRGRDPLDQVVPLAGGDLGGRAEGISARFMWSTVTLTPLVSPHFCT